MTTPKKNKFSDITIPWYIKCALLLFASKFDEDFSSGIRKVNRYKTIGKKKYIIDYDFDIKKKRFGITGKITF